MKPHQVASIVRKSIQLLDGKEGPRLAQLDMRLLLVRTPEFYYDLARDLREWTPAVMRDIKSTQESAPPRLDHEKIVSGWLAARQQFPVGAKLFARLMAKRTMRQIYKEFKTRDPRSIADDIAAVSAYIVNYCGKSMFYGIVEW